MEVKNCVHVGGRWESMYNNAMMGEHV